MTRSPAINCGSTRSGDRAAAPPDCNPVSMPDEAALVHAAQDDRAAFGVLYHRYVDRVYAYVRARTTTEEDAADLTQHVFVQALHALPQYRVQTVPFAAWLFRIARNAAIDAHRRRRITVAWDFIPEALQPIGDRDPEDSALRRDAIEQLRTLLRALNQETRELLALRFAAGLTMAEIAAVIGTSEAATKKRLARALHGLKEQYHDAPR